MKNLFCPIRVLQNFDQFNYKIVLSEERVRNSKIEIRGIPSDTVIIKLDVESINYKQKSFYLDKYLKHIHKGCDYVMIIPSMKLNLFFELKSLKPKPIDYVNQFKISEIFLDYCISLNNYIQAEINKSEFDNIYILLTPKFDRHYTDSNKIYEFSVNDLKGNEVKIISPGFPKHLDLRKLISKKVV